MLWGTHPHLLSEVLGYREESKAYLSCLTPIMCPALLSRWGIDMGRAPVASLCTERVSTLFKATQPVSGARLLVTALRWVLPHI